MATKFVAVSTDPWTGIEDKPGSFGRVARALAEKAIPIDAFTIGPSGLRILTPDHRSAAASLRTAGFKTEIVEYLEVDVASRADALAQVGEELGKARVNIVASFGVPGEGIGRAFLRVDHPERATPVLQRLGSAGLEATVKLRR